MLEHWLHTVCDDCWAEGEGWPVRRQPAQALEACCFCGAETRSGIHVRVHPDEVACRGQHEPRRQAAVI
jgi:hypothetical protein